MTIRDVNDGAWLLCRNLQHSAPWRRDEGLRGLRVPELSYWFGLTRVVCLLAPFPDELFNTAAETRPTQHLLIRMSVRESPHISSCIARLVSRWRVGANDKITSDTYGSALSP